MLVPYLCQISASVLGSFGEVQALDLPACSPEQLVSRKCRMLFQLPHSISLCLKEVALISNLCEYVDLPQMYCDALSRHLNPGCSSSEFSSSCGISTGSKLHHFAGLTVMESLLELHLASLFLANLGFDDMVQGLYVQSPVLQFWEQVSLTPVSADYLILDLW